MTEQPLKAWSVTCTGLGDPEPLTVTEWAATRSKARMQVALKIQDAGWEDRIGRILPTLRVVRQPERDEPARTLDPRMTDVQRRIMEHAIGFEKWRGRPGVEPYRNHYVREAIGWEPVAALVALGWMEYGRPINDGRDAVSRVTAAGFRALGLPVPAGVTDAPLLAQVNA